MNRHGIHHLHRNRPSTQDERGAALATAIFFLVIITLLGLAAMRAGNIDLRLAQNEVGRVDALQNGQTSLDGMRAALYAQADQIPVLPGSNYVQYCAVGDALDSSALSTQQGFSCTSDMSNANTGLLPATIYKKYSYVSVRRESVGSNDFAPVNAIRRGDSGNRYQLASFTLTAGYDRIATKTSEAPQGGAEVAQGVYVRVAQVRGLTQQ